MYAIHAIRSKWPPSFVHRINTEPTLRIVGAIVAICAAGDSGRAERWSVRESENGGCFEILLDQKQFATYSFRDSEIQRPYFANIYSPSGTKITRNHPPESGDPQDHDTLHPGLWLAFGDVSGEDYWRLKAPVEHVRFVERPGELDGTLRFAVENRYLSANRNREICREICRYELHPRENGVLIIWESDFRSDVGDFYFGDQEEFGVGVRLATPIAVKSEPGGRILNSDGLRNEDALWGKQADWCDYSGTIKGEFVGITIMPDPRNFRRSWFHARDYGFMAANPFGRNAFTGGEPSRVDVKKGSEFELNYGVLFHWNDTASKFNPSDAYQKYLLTISYSES